MPPAPWDGTISPRSWDDGRLPAMNWPRRGVGAAAGVLWGELALWGIAAPRARLGRSGHHTIYVYPDYHRLPRIQRTRIMQAQQSSITSAAPPSTGGSVF